MDEIICTNCGQQLPIIFNRSLIECVFCKQQNFLNNKDSFLDSNLELPPKSKPVKDLQFKPVDCLSSTVKSHRLSRSVSSQLQIWISFPGFMTALLMIIVPVIASYFVYLKEIHIVGASFIYLVLCLIFLKSINSLKCRLKAHYFDLSLQQYYRSWPPLWLFKPTKKVSFYEFQTFQLITIMNKGDEGADYLTYQLNIVKRCGERINIFEHGHLKETEYCAKTLSTKLNRPLILAQWSYCDESNN